MSTKDRYRYTFESVAKKDAVIKGHNYRLTVLADGVLRFEWAEDGTFEDRASTFATQRELAVPEFYIIDQKESLQLVTKRFHLFYNKKKFTRKGFIVNLRGNYTGVWQFGDEIHDLGGTIRTLDTVNGRSWLGHGVLSKDGFGMIDDSDSFLFEKNGWIGTRRPGNRYDGYIFCYGRDYRDAMHDFYAISGSQPLLPRFSLGNWWSRYHPYTDKEYLGVMDKFQSENVPLSVAVIDINWHYVDIDPRYGSGWTGYSWNKTYFPDPDQFLSQLHERGLRTTLNDHPADGVRAFEDQYEDVAKFMEVDWKHGEKVDFDCVDQKFMDAYFDIIHRQHEKRGVDFWWIDWQQGDRSRIPGIDPLWMLNHYQYKDSSIGKERPLILSRFAGPGSQRYQVGFSGDTVMTWGSLHFQPEFTATASNIGYGWWSHDIGGHMSGYKNDELMTRWYQFGCFSPILRLHCSNNIFNYREPWNFNPEAAAVMEDILRFRHRLIPYLYTMNVRSAAEDEPLVQPVYWEYPHRNEAYENKNQYYFGTQLLILPITQARDRQTHLGSIDAWLPPSRWVDIFTGMVYDGDRHVSVHRPLSQYPVFAKEGAIIPLDGNKQWKHGVTIPSKLELLIVVGADGDFELIEDDGNGSRVEHCGFSVVSQDGTEESDDELVEFSRTPITYNQAFGRIRIGATSPRSPAIPRKRDWTIRLISHTQRENPSMSVGGTKRSLSWMGVDNGTLLELGSVSSSEDCVVELGTSPQLDVADAAKRCWDILTASFSGYDQKSSVWWTISSGENLSERVNRLKAMNLPKALLDALAEVLEADSRWSS